MSHLHRGRAGSKGRLLLRVGAGTALAALVLVALAGTKASAHGKALAAVPRIGSPGPAFAGPPLIAEREARLLRRGPKRAGKQSPEFEVRGERRRKRRYDQVGPESSPGTPRTAVTPRTAAAISPVPVTSWQAKTGTPPSPTVGQGTPPDPQIAVSSTHVVVGVGSGLLFYTKSGKPYPDGKNYLNETNLFQPLIDAAQLAKNENGHIDNFNDLRVIFDPYRHRFWTVATGAYRSSACWKGPGCKKNGDPCPSPAPKNSICVKGAQTLPPDQERMVVGLAVSRDEDPTHGWYLYYWDAAIGWKTHEAPYKPRDMGDYPSIGINATTVDVSNIVTDNWTLPAPGNQKVRAYPHIALYKADDMAAGKGPTIPGWHLYPLISADGKVCDSGFRNEDGTCPAALIQPTLAHPDPGGSFLVGREGSNKLSVWKVTDLLQPTQAVTAATVKATAWTNPKNARQQGGGSTNYVALKNGLTDPLKSVWRWFLYVVTQDASSSGRGYVRVLRL
jgi:hypothetical protein